jgi:hypothetical protein
MHPFGMYLAIRDSQRANGWVAVDKRRTQFAKVDALPLLETERAPLSGRLAAALRRLVMREHHDLAGDQAPRLLPR